MTIVLITYTTYTVLITYLSYQQTINIYSSVIKKRKMIRSLNIQRFKRLKPEFSFKGALMQI